jgi:hypothetical protein
MSGTRHKTLTPQEALEYVAFAVWYRDLPEEFDGQITCELNEDGSVEVYVVDQEIVERQSLN